MPERDPDDLSLPAGWFRLWADRGCRERLMAHLKEQACAIISIGEVQMLVSAAQVLDWAMGLPHVVAVAATSQAQDSAPTIRRRWEYQMVSLDLPRTQCLAKLERLGAKGWEACARSWRGPGETWLFKREAGPADCDHDEYVDPEDRESLPDPVVSCGGCPKQIEFTYAPAVDDMYDEGWRESKVNKRWFCPDCVVVIEAFTTPPPENDDAAGR